MKRFFHKLGRLFWSWDFLRFVLWTITLIVLFYAEEDWRGAHAWAATKAKWEARGETFDYAKFIPKPMPDSQNLAALPLFRLEPFKDTDGKSYLGDVALRRVLRQDGEVGDISPGGNELPSMGRWQRGELPDAATIENGIKVDYLAAFKGANPPSDPLAQLDALYPFIDELATTSTKRPQFLIIDDYAGYPPVLRHLGIISDQIRLSRILALHAIVALNNHRPDVALTDLKINHEILSGIARDPTLVGGLVAMGMAAIGDAALYDGLNRHAWNDAQLAELEEMADSVDFLAIFQFDIRSELAASLTNFDAFKKVMHRQSLFGPIGWMEYNKGQLAACDLQELTVNDPKLHRAFPGMGDQLGLRNDRAQEEWDAKAPWNIWFTMASSVLGKSARTYAQGQVIADEARIACALERYWLVHHAYPASLEALVPYQIKVLPQDVINGEPYHYQVRPDGRFLLYSVGWNQRDDGGNQTFKANGSMDEERGDWVWPTPK